MIATVALAAAATLAFASPLGAANGDTASIVVSAPASTDVCSPCHPIIGTADSDRIIFDHASHLLTSCTACHTTTAHKEGATAVPTMASCFNCHGMFHGKMGELASGECVDCHQPGFPLRPVSHVEDWEAKPHAEASAAAGVNGCILCHEPAKDCDACHTEQRLDLPKMPSIYLSVLPEVQAEATVTVDPTKPVSISQCAYCHSDIDDFQVDGLIFGHTKHLERAFRCEACHERFPHGPNGTAQPPMRGCMRCHGLEHNGSGLVSSGECLKCHTAEFELMPAAHTVEFLSGEHNEPAAQDPAYCAQCHQPTTCVECHNGGVVLASGTVGEKVIPEDHKTVEWQKDHGGLYLEQKGMCVVCHTP
jgi:hypothetical protein